MSSAAPFPMGFIASMKWKFDGDIPEKVWRSFRTKFSKEHAPGWQVKKLAYKSWQEEYVYVSFRTTNPDTAREMTADQWEFLRATLSLLAVKSA